MLTHAQPATSGTPYAALPDTVQHLLEKPVDKEDNLRMLLDMNGTVCEVVTGVTIGQWVTFTGMTSRRLERIKRSLSDTHFAWIRDQVCAIRLAN